MLMVVLALGAALSNSVFSLANRWVAVRGGVDPLRASLQVQVAAGVLALGTILLLRVPWRGGATAEVLGVGALSMLAFVLMMLAFQREDASAVAPMLGLKVIFVLIMEGHLLRGIGVPAGAVLSVLGVMCSSQTDRWSLHPRDLWRPGVAIMLLAALCFALCDLMVKRTLHAWGGDSLAVALYLVATSGIIAALVLLGMAARTRTAALHAPRPVWAPLLLSALTCFLMQYCIFGAFAQAGNITVPNIIYNTRSLLVVGLAALLVLGRGSTLETARTPAYLYRTIGALATLGAIALALMIP